MIMYVLEIDYCVSKWLKFFATSPPLALLYFAQDRGYYFHWKTRRAIRDKR